MFLRLWRNFPTGLNRTRFVSGLAMSNFVAATTITFNGAGFSLLALFSIFYHSTWSWSVALPFPRTIPFCRVSALRVASIPYLWSPPKLTSPSRWSWMSFGSIWVWGQLLSRDPPIGRSESKQSALGPFAISTLPACDIHLTRFTIGPRTTFVANANNRPIDSSFPCSWTCWPLSRICSQISIACTRNMTWTAQIVNHSWNIDYYFSLCFTQIGFLFVSYLQSWDHLWVWYPSPSVSIPFICINRGASVKSKIIRLSLCPS